VIIDKPLAHYTRNSFFAHVAITLACLFFSYLYYQQNLNLRRSNLKLVQASVRVDMVALPERTLKELRSLQQLQKLVPKVAKQKKEAPKTKPKIEPQKVKKGDFLKKGKKKSLSDMLKKYSNKKTTKVVGNKRKKTKVRDDSLSNKDLSALSKLVKKGNIVKSGAALAGTGHQEILSALEEYSAGLPELVRAHWSLPSYLLESDLKCRIRIYVNKDGTLIRKVVFESSEDAEYDQRAMRAIELVGKFPPVPVTIQKNVAQGDIVLAFPL
jgi:colicin import membrane protein